MTLHEHETQQPIWWEPGRPFQVGDRVRIRLSGECTAKTAQGSVIQGYYSSDGLHLPDDDGLDGTIVDLMAQAAEHLEEGYDIADVENLQKHFESIGHPYSVEVHRTTQDGVRYPMILPFAAAELELLEAASS